MIYPEKRTLFTISDVSKACGVSRTTLIRMEESGFLKPFYTDPDTGYRYYDAQNVAAVGQYQRLQSIGLSRKEITDLYYGKTDSATFLSEQRAKLRTLQRFLDEYELRSDKRNDFTFSYVNIPEATYYTAHVSGRTPEELGMAAYLAHEKCISEGYRLLGSEPISTYYEDYQTLFNQGKNGYDGIMCIPVISDSTDDPKIRRFPATKGFSIIGFGDYSNIRNLWKTLLKEAEARGIRPSGPARMLALVAAYTGAHFKTEDFCYECIIPTEEK